MTISAIGSGSVQAFAPPRPRHEPPPMSNTAELLGMTADELQQAQRSGTTLNDLATQRGVSADDLIRSITADLKANKPDGAPDPSDDQLADMASHIASGQRPSGPPPADRAQGNLQDLANMLGVDVDTLLDGDLQGLLRQTSATGYGSTVGGSLSGGLSVDRYA